MLLKGTIYITNDINLCLANLNMCKTIVIADEPDKYNIPGKVGGSLLLPPYEAMSFMIDGDEERFSEEYMNYLMNDITTSKFINIILQALIAGTNIILFIDPEGINFQVALKNFFAFTFGIFIGDQSNPFKFDITYEAFILNRLYAEDCISKEEYLLLYPLEAPFDGFIIGKLSYDYRIQFAYGFNPIDYFKKQSLILKNGGNIKGVVKRL